MKKLFLLLLSLLFITMLVSCEMQNAPDPEVVKDSESRFVMINWSTVDNKPDVYVYVDTETGVAYATTLDGSLMPLYDTDGSILVYEEYIK